MRYISAFQSDLFKSDNMSNQPVLARARAFCAAFGIRVPILMAPMGSASPTSLAIAVANAGGLGGCGAVGMQPDAIRAWASDVRGGSNGAFQLNLWIPRDPAPKRDMVEEDAVRRFLGNWGPEVPRAAGDFTLTLRLNVRPYSRRDHRSFPRSWGFIPIASWRA